MARMHMETQIAELRAHLASLRATCARATALAPARLQALFTRLNVAAEVVIQHCTVGHGQTVHLAAVEALVESALDVAGCLADGDIVYLFLERRPLARFLHALQERLSAFAAHLKITLPLYTPSYAKELLLKDAARFDRLVSLYAHAPNEMAEVVRSMPSARLLKVHQDMHEKAKEPLTLPEKEFVALAARLVDARLEVARLGMRSPAHRAREESYAQWATTGRTKSNSSYHQLYAI